MTHDEFVNEYTEVAWLALRLSMKARREGLLALEEELENIDDEWKLLLVGLRLVVDGTDEKIVDKILSNKIKQEKDEYTAKLKTIQKEAVLMIQEGLNPRLLYYVLNSYTGIPFKEDEVFKKLEETMQKEEV
jgi:flagellar motor component MotA